MPILNDATMDEQQASGSNFKFSATNVDNLGASEYTLASVVADVSGSTSGVRDSMEDISKEVVRAMRLSPRADNLLYRNVVFANNVEEIHGFKLLENINEADYDGSLTTNLPSGIGYETALYDASYQGAKAINDYADTLRQNFYTTNAILVVITDGMNNASSVSVKRVAEEFKRAVDAEALESFTSILIALNTHNPTIASTLQAFSRDAGFTHYIEAGEANKKNIARVAQFVSKSVSHTSQSLGNQPPNPTSLSF